MFSLILLRYDSTPKPDAIIRFAEAAERKLAAVGSKLWGSTSGLINDMTEILSPPTSLTISVITLFKEIIFIGSALQALCARIPKRNSKIEEGLKGFISV